MCVFVASAAPAPPAAGHLAALVHAAAARTPQHSAVLAPRHRTELTFAELVALAGAVAARLRARGVRAGGRVALWCATRCLLRACCLRVPARSLLLEALSGPCCRICSRSSSSRLFARLARSFCHDSFERSPLSLVATLGVLTAGAACVPLDPAYPHDRLEYMLSDSAAQVVLTHADAPLVGERAKRLELDLDELRSDVAANKAKGGSTTTLTAQLDDDQCGPRSICYILYTSGSTGRPKGVEMPHEALVNLITWQIAHSPEAARGRTLHFAPTSFDVSFQEIFSSWAAGGTVVVLPEETRRDLRTLVSGRGALSFSCAYHLLTWLLWRVVGIIVREKLGESGSLAHRATVLAVHCA